MKSRFPQRARRVLVWSHLWLGLILGAWFSLIGLTGSVLTWRTELGAAELSRRFPVSQPSPNAKIVSLSDATGALKKAMPDLDTKEIAGVTIPGARSSFYAFTLGRNRRTARQVLVDPYSSQILGTVAPRSGNVFLIQNFHQRLIAGARGYLFNGLLTLLSVPLLMSGLWLWWPAKIAQFKARLTVKRGAPLHRKIYDWHNIFGVYLYSTLFITTLTGVLLVANHIARDGWAKTWEEVRAGETPPARETRGARGGQSEGRGAQNEGARQERGASAPAQNAAPGGREAPKVVPQGESLDADTLLNRARQAVPQYQITRVQLPSSPDAPFEASYSLPTGFATNRTLYLNPYSGEVLPGKQPEGANYNSVVRGLHLGDFGGVLMKLIYTITGLMPLGLFASGVWLWARKKRRAKHKTPRETAPQTVSTSV